MSVVGFDLGNQSCYIAVARQGGIETVANEYSDRCTPTVVSFGDARREIGTAAKNQQISNIKNTLTSWKHFIGRKFQDPVVQYEKNLVPYAVVEGPDGSTVCKCQYLGEEHYFTPEQLVAMQLTKLKDVAETNLKAKLVDCVLSVPVYYPDTIRRAMLDASQMAGLNCLRLMNDTTAVALAYGIYKQDLPLPEEPPRIVIIIDMGYTSLQICAASFNKGKLKVLATASDPNLGGRDIDRVIVGYFVEEFKKKYKIDTRTNPKALCRLTNECEKLKRLMSANSTPIPLNIECFMDDKDVTGKLKRSDMEEMIVSLMSRVEKTMREILVNSNLKVDDIYSVEIVGGSTRVPAVKSVVNKVFGKEASTTLNTDEAVARGLALQCAILSPTFRVRDFSITDCQPYPITLSWQAAMDEDPCSDMEVFTRYHQFPFSKMLTFYRQEKFTLNAKYSNKQIPYPTTDIGNFTVEKVAPPASGESAKIKVKVRVNIHGVFNVSSASQVDKIETMEADDKAPAAAATEEEPMEQNGSVDTNQKGEPTAADDTSKDEATKTEPMQTDDQAKEAATKTPETENGEKEKSPKKPKTKVKTTDLPITASVPSLAVKDIEKYFEKEHQMIMQDKLEKDRADAKNTVEEYVYEMRDKLSSSLEAFVKEKDSTKFSELLEQTEDWLYDEGEDQKKAVYQEKYTMLQKFGKPIVLRQVESQKRPRAFEDLGKSLQLVQKAVDSYNAKDEKYEHLDDAEMKKVEKMVQEKRDWFEKQVNACSSLPLHQDSPVLASQIISTKEELTTFCLAILNKPKPKPKEEPPKEEKTEAPAAATPATPAAETPQPEENATSDTPQDKADMELD